MFDLQLLQQLYSATVAGSFIFLTEVQFAGLLSAGYVEVNRDAYNPQNLTYPVRMSAQGLAYVQSLPQTPTQPVEAPMTEATAVQTEVFVIESDVPLVETPRTRVQGESKYHFDKLEVGQSFFVPNTEQRKDAVKTLVSAALAAQKRTAIKTGETKIGKTGKTVQVLKYTRKFVVKAAEKDGVAGARVWRKA